MDLNGDGHYIYHTKDGDYFLKMDGLSDEVIKGIDGVLDIDDSLDVGEFLYITKEEIKDNFSDEDNCIYIVEETDCRYDMVYVFRSLMELLEGDFYEKEELLDQLKDIYEEEVYLRIKEDVEKGKLIYQSLLDNGVVDDFDYSLCITKVMKFS